MRRALILVFAFTTTGCGPWSRFTNDISGQLTPYCFNGATYLALGEHALVRAWDRDGKPLKCGNGLFEEGSRER